MLKSNIQKALNIPEEDFDSHFSDLYIKYTKDRLEWIKDNYEFGKSNSIVSTFTGSDGKRWIEVAFAKDIKKYY